jgi:hypothetical protein
VKNGAVLRPHDQTEAVNGIEVRARTCPFGKALPRLEPILFLIFYEVFQPHRPEADACSRFGLKPPIFVLRWKSSLHDQIAEIVSFLCEIFLLDKSKKYYKLEF